MPVPWYAGQASRECIMHGCSVCRRNELNMDATLGAD